MTFIGITFVSLITVSSIYILYDLKINWKLYWCKWKHKHWHQYMLIEYGGGYLVTCSKCKEQFTERR